MKIEEKRGRVALVLSVLTLILAITIAVFPTVAGYGKLEEKVDNSVKDYEDHISQSYETLKNIESRIIVVETKMAGTEVSVSAIKEDVSEIKDDIKMIAINLNSRG